MYYHINYSLRKRGGIYVSMKKRVLSFSLLIIMLASLLPVGSLAASDAYYEEVYQWNLMIYEALPAGDRIPRSYLEPVYGVTRDYSDITALAGTIIAGASSDYEKAEAVHRWVAGNIWYGEQQDLTSANDILNTRTGICGDYSALAVALLRGAGIPAFVVYGSANIPDSAQIRLSQLAAEDHIWNLAYADDQWIIMDATFDSKNHIVDGEYSPQQPAGTDFFDIPLSEFSISHVFTARTGIFASEFIVPDAISEIPPWAFRGCTSLRNLIVPNANTRVGLGLFGGCSLKNITIFGHPGTSAEAGAERNRVSFRAGFTGDLDAPNTDVASRWAVDGIRSAVAKGFVPGYIQDSYTDAITREEFVLMAIRFIEYYLGDSIDMIMAQRGVMRDQRRIFSDTAANCDILAAYALGIINGTEAPVEILPPDPLTGDIGSIQPGKFSPDGELTREQAAVIMRNLCQTLGMDVSDASDQGFADITSASAWAADSINFARAAGIMAGTGSAPPMFSPKELFTRQESMIVFDRIR